jgi:Ca2+-binding EF-hand superfamily protein
MNVCILQVVRSTILEYDKDGDGQLNLKEFSQLVSQDDMDACILP